MSGYYLRGIDPNLWKRVKAQATYEGRSLRFVLLALLKVYAKHGYKVVERFNGRHHEE